MARYHAGTWVGSDEEMAVPDRRARAFTRRSRSHGRPEVSRARAWRRPGALTINAFDAGSMREMFEGAPVGQC